MHGCLLHSARLNANTHQSLTVNDNAGLKQCPEVTTANTKNHNFLPFCGVMSLWFDQEHIFPKKNCYKNIILCCQLLSVELLHKSRFIMFGNEHSFSSGHEILKMKLFFWKLQVKHRVGRKQHCTHSQRLIRGTSG